MVRRVLREINKYDPDHDTGFLVPVRKVCYHVFWFVVCGVYVFGVCVFFLIGLAGVYAFAGMLMLADKVRGFLGMEPRY